MKFWKSWRRFIENQRGAYLVIVAVLLPLLLTFAGLAVDLGRGYAHKAKLQNAADAGVMAAAHIYFPNKSHDEVYEWAQRYMDANHGNEAYNIDQITVRTLKEGTSSKDKENTVLISLYASEKVPVSFMAVMGFDAMPVNVVATAKVTPKPGEKDPGVWGYAFICGDGRDADQCGGGMDQNGAPFQVWQAGHRVIGKVHTNGAVSLNGGGTDFNTGTKYSLFVEPGSFSTSISDDSKLWRSYGQSGWGHDEKDNPKMPWYANDQKIDGQWRNYIRFGYYENNPWGYIGTDVVAQKAYDKNIDISLSKDNSQTEAIYNYVEDLRTKYGNTYKSDGIFLNAQGDYGNYKRSDAEDKCDYESWGYDRNAFSTIVVDGSIVINDQQYSNTAKYLTIISLHGNVTIRTNEPIKALVYAPNGQVTFTGTKGDTTNYSFEGSIVGKYITLDSQNRGLVTYKWNSFDFGSGGSGSSGSGSSGSGSGSGSSSGTGGVESIILYKDEDPNYGNEQAI